MKLESAPSNGIQMRHTGTDMTTRLDRWWQNSVCREELSRLTHLWRRNKQLELNGTEKTMTHLPALPHTGWGAAGEDETRGATPPLSCHVWTTGRWWTDECEDPFPFHLDQYGPERGKESSHLHQSAHFTHINGLTHIHRILLPSVHLITSNKFTDHQTWLSLLVKIHHTPCYTTHGLLIRWISRQTQSKTQPSWRNVWKGSGIHHLLWCFGLQLFHLTSRWNNR